MDNTSNTPPIDPENTDSAEAVDSNVLFAVVHDEKPKDVEESAICLATLNTTPMLPDGMRMNSNVSTKLQVACLSDQGSGLEWSSFDQDPDWRDKLGDALVEANTAPGTWRWVTMHPANA